MSANISQAIKFIKQVQAVSLSQDFKKDGLTITGNIAKGGKGDHGKIIWFVNGVRVKKDGFRSIDNDKKGEKGQYRTLRRIHKQMMEN